ncbi:ThiF family adenylyltransferase [Paenibacillus sp. N3/727]|uniref:ThiF family adenylyltransferase n=1 Tax=Paenibacillus sp. N3/727 TaxID=2925845 RepID=UPI001F539286|nr:ThiF family adenylyltransferase [Paenibacillus sp. N3/727]UNK16245.1 ThiF family adenylyltransferase [Paenibacillus sp. N3/727]
MCEARYSRQQGFVPIGVSGQAELQRKHVLIVGAGALGSGIADILARAGVGTMTIIDRDYVEWSNLQRQTLYDEQDAAEQMPKAVAAARRLRQINSNIDIRAHVMDCTAADLKELMASSVIDLIMDATDNYEIRFILNDVAYQYDVPWIHGACSGSYGVTCNFMPQRTPCLHCLLASIPLGAATCDRNGVIAPAVQMVVAMQATEALKYLSGNSACMSERYTVFDLWSNTFQSFRINADKRQDSCPTCGSHRTYPYLQTKAALKTEVLCGRTSVWIRPPHHSNVDLDELARSMRRSGNRVTSNSYLVQVEDGEHRIVIFADGRALVHGTADSVTAKKLYHRYLG